MIPATRADPGTLARRFQERWLSHGWSRGGDRLVVACSGGVDSLTLLHLLRFSAPGIEGEIEVATFDHRIRSESAEEVLWLRGIARCWGIPFHLGRAEEVPANEEEARSARYRFFEGLLEGGARWILTAHQEEDQVETILFRILRGTGIEGLRGIPEVRPPGILRPLLTFSRREIEGYARTAHLHPRPDPTNQSLHHARNRIRHALLPALTEVHPGAREGILRVGRHATSSAAALDLLLLPLRDALLHSSRPDRIEVDRDAFLALEAPIGAELLRSLVNSLGGALDEAGTATALEFMRKGSSGRAISLEEGLSIAREFERLVIARRSADPGSMSGDALEESPPVIIGGPEGGTGHLVLLGRRFDVCWGTPPAEEGWSWVDLPGEKIHLPLELRGWRPGDRMRTTGGEKKLKKLFVELRIPSRERARTPLLVDASGEVLWIPGWKAAASLTRRSAEVRGWGVGVRPAGEG